MNLIYTTFANEKDAREIAKHLLTEKLIGCAHILPMGSSIYVWEGDIVEEAEVVAFFKTTDEKTQKTIDRIEKLHNYATACVFAFNVEKVSNDYNSWLEAVLNR